MPNSKISQIKLPNNSVYDIDLPKDNLKVIYNAIDGMAGTAGNNSAAASYLSAKWTIANASGATQVYDGMKVLVKIPVTGLNNVGTVLSIDGGTTYHPLAYNKNTVLTTQYPVDTYKLFVYNASLSMACYLTSGKKSTITGIWCGESNYDSNTTMTYGTLAYYFRPYTSSALYRYKLCMLDKDNRLVPLTAENLAETATAEYSSSTSYAKDAVTASGDDWYKSLSASNKNHAPASSASYWTKLTPNNLTPTSVAFKPDKIYWYNTTTTVNAGAAIGGNTLMDIGYNAPYICYCNFTQSLRAYRMVYLCGTYNKTTGLFTLRGGGTNGSTDYFTQVPTNTANITLSSYFTSGYDYILVGGTYSAMNYFHLRDDHPMFHFDGTNLVPYDTYNENRIENLIPAATETFSLSLVTSNGYSKADISSSVFAQIMTAHHQGKNIRLTITDHPEIDVIIEEITSTADPTETTNRLKIGWWSGKYSYWTQMSGYGIVDLDSQYDNVPAYSPIPIRMDYVTYQGKTAISYQQFMEIFSLAMDSGRDIYISYPGMYGYKSFKHMFRIDGETAYARLYFTYANDMLSYPEKNNESIYYFEAQYDPIPDPAPDYITLTEELFNYTVIDLGSNTSGTLSEAELAKVKLEPAKIALKCNEDFYYADTLASASTQIFSAAIVNSTSSLSFKKLSVGLSSGAWTAWTSNFTPAGAVSSVNTQTGAVTVSLASKDSTATGRITYLQGLSSTGASASGTDTFLKSISPVTKYLHPSTTNAAPNSHTHTVTVSGTSGKNSGSGVSVVTGISGGSGSLTSNNTATDGIAYIASASHTAASLGTPSTGTVTVSGGTASGTTKYLSASFSGTAATITPTLGGTKTFNTDAIKAVSLSASETNTDGPTYVQSISGSAPSLTGTKTFVTGVSGGSGSFTASREETTGTGARRTLTLSHTHTAASSSGTGTVGISGGSYTATTRYMKATGTAASTGTVSITGASYTPAGSVTLTENDATATGRIAYTKSVSSTAASLGGTTTFVTGYPNFSGGSGSHTTKYLHHTHTAASASGTGTAAPNEHTHSYGSSTALTTSANSGSAVAAITSIAANSSSATGDITFVESVANGSTASAVTGVTGGTTAGTTKYLAVEVAGS